MSEPIKTNVLIVGAGPSGMTAALALARFGSLGVAKWGRISKLG